MMPEIGDIPGTNDFVHAAKNTRGAVVRDQQQTLRRQQAEAPVQVLPPLLTLWGVFPPVRLRLRPFWHMKIAVVRT
jgi:hypothetical protein